MVTGSDLASLYRPKTFSEVIGQTTAVKALKRIAAADGIAARAVFLHGSYGSGKCISGDQRVVTSTGYRRIKDIMPNAPYGFTPLEIEVEQADGSFAKTSHFYRERGVRLHYVECRSDCVYTGTDDHPIMAFTKTGGLGLTRCGDLQPGDYVARLAVAPFDYLKARAESGGYSGGIDGRGFSGFSSRMEVALGLLTTLLTGYPVRLGESVIGFTCLSPDFTVDLVDALDYLGLHYAIDADITEDEYVVMLSRESSNVVINWMLGDAMYHNAYPSTEVLPEDVEYYQNIVDRCPVSYENVAKELCLSGDAPEGAGLYRYDRVVSVTTMVEDVYDLTVPSTHLFVSSGVVNHNTTLSRILGRAMNCESFRKLDDVCNECDGCREASAANSNTYWEFDSAAIGNVEGVKRIQEAVLSTPLGRRVITLDEAHACTRQSLNALLKLIEDGVKDTMFVFASTEDLLPTIRSRCVVIDIGTIPLNLIASRVREICGLRGVEITDDQVDILAMRSGGHMRNALKLLEYYEIVGDVALDSSYMLFRDFVANAFSTLPKQDPKEMLKSLLLYPVVDLKQSIGLLIRNVYNPHPGSLEERLQRAGLGKTLFGFFFNPTAQQALGSEVGIEILLSSLLERIGSSRQPKS